MSDPTTVSGTDLRAERLRETVLDALSQITVDGTREVSVHDVARVAGVSRTSVYHLFPGGLEDMTVALADTFFEVVEAVAQREIATAPSTSPTEAVRAHLHALVQIADWRWRLLRSSLDWKVRSSAREHVDHRLAQLLEPLLDDLGDAVPRGVDRSTLAAFLAGGIILELTDWIRAHDGPGTASPEQFEQDLLDGQPRWFVGSDAVARTTA